MEGGRPKGQQMANLNPYGDLPINEGPYNTTPQKLKNIEGYNIFKKIPNQHEIKIRFDKLYNMPINIKKEKNLTLFEEQKEKLQKLLKKYQKSNATNENKNELQNKYFKYGKKQNQELFNRFLKNADSSKINTKLNNNYALNIAKQIIIRDKGQNFLTNPGYKQLEERVKAKILAKINNNRYIKTNNPNRKEIYQITASGEENINLVNL
jgi:small-conductance mechanosensitive channel